MYLLGRGLILLMLDLHQKGFAQMIMLMKNVKRSASPLARLAMALVVMQL